MYALVKLRSNDRNISTQHIATLLGVTCRARSATLLRRVATCRVLLAQIRGKWSHFSCNVCRCCMMLYSFGYVRAKDCCTNLFTSSMGNTQHVATHCNRVAKRTQHVAPHNIVAICCVQMLRSFGRRNAEPTMLC